MQNNFFNKTGKGDISARKIIFYILFGFLMTIAFLITLWVVPATGSEISQIPIGLENYLLSQRFFDSPLCFVYQDSDTHRDYPSIIDIKKFNQENLNECYDTKDTNVKAYQFTLDYDKESKTISTENWKGFLWEGETKQISVYDDGKIKGATLFIETQNER